MSDYTLLVPLVAICIILSSMYKNIGMKRQERTHCDIDNISMKMVLSRIEMHPLCGFI